MATPETAVRTYLNALKDPSSLRDDDAIASTTAELEGEGDPVARLQLHQKLAELNSPSMEAVEDAFVMHSKSWADDMGISGEAFLAEGVSSATLRRAGFNVGRSKGRGRATTGARRSTRVTTEEVIDAMPSGAFTVKMLKEASGASPAVVRKAIAAEVEAGNLTEAGADPDHTGPGRAPTLYRKG